MRVKTFWHMEKFGGGRKGNMVHCGQRNSVKRVNRAGTGRGMTVKKVGWLLCLVILGVLAASGAHAERDMTIMVYMCGSNLESGYGAATDDLMEMNEARLDSAETALLVMTGGARSWAAGFDADQACIHEVSRKGIRTVWSGEAMNMGESGTLTFFLKWGKDAYPAEKYALIFWNHGAGPVEGLCWDEQFAMDHLSLTEMTDALKAAEMDRRLSFIGFDACLMSTVEVADAVSEYAEYMIASQETEPASGWDYRFLKDMSADRDGADTGKRIVESFKAASGSVEDVTLACVDLDRIGPVVTELNRLFSREAGSMTEKAYAALSEARSGASAFGGSMAVLGSHGYDLVDLADFASRLDDSADLLAAIREAVVCRTDTAGIAGGLSIYHPYQNKTEYVNTWREAYESMGFSTEYARYLRAFGGYLTGERMCRWTDLVPREKGEGTHTYVLPLTEEQAGNVAGARMLVLQSLRGKSGRNIFLLLNTLPALTGPEGLEGTYAPGKLYARTEDGTVLGPVSVTATDDGRRLLAVGAYDTDMDGVAGSEDGGATVVFWLENPMVPGVVRPSSTLVYDEATREFTRRIPLREADYARVVLWNIDRSLPDEDVEELPAFRNWDADSGFISGFQVNLPQAWEFVCLEEEMNVTDLYVAFEITDLQQNAWCSRPIPIGNGQRSGFQAEEVEIGEAGITFSGQIRESVTESGLYLWCDVENRSDVERNYRIDHILLNGCREISGNFSLYSVEGGKDGGRMLRVDPKDLYGMEEIHSIRANVEWTDAGTWDWSEACAAETGFADFDISGMAWNSSPLGRASEDGIECILLSLDGGEGSEISGEMLVRNGKDTELDLEAWEFLPENLRLSASVSPRTLGAGQECVARFTLQDRLEAGMFQTGVDEALGSAVVTGSLLQMHAGGVVHELRIVTGQDLNAGEMGKDLRLQLETAWQVPGNGTVQATPETLFEEGTLLVKAEHVMAASDSLVIGLSLTNRGSRPLYAAVQDGHVQGRPVSMSVAGSRLNGMILMPGSTRFACVIFSGTGETLLPEMDFRIRWWGGLTELDQEGLQALDLFGAWLSVEELLSGKEGIPPETRFIRMIPDKVMEIPEDRWLGIPAGDFRVVSEP